MVLKKGFSFCRFCFHALHCELQGGFHTQFSWIQGGKQNETRTRSHKLRTRSGNPQHTHLPADWPSKPSKAKQTKQYVYQRSSPKAMLFFPNPSNPETQIKNLENVVFWTLYIHMYIYIYSYSMLFIFFGQSKKCTSLTAFPHLNASWSDLPLSLFQANFWICEDRVRLPTFRVYRQICLGQLLGNNKIDQNRTWPNMDIGVATTTLGL